MRFRRFFTILLGFGLTTLAANGQACTRVVYHGEEGLNITGRTMDWRDPMNTRLWLFPAGLQENGGAGKDSAEWKSRYGSVAVTSLNAAVSDGMNQKGLVANMLWLNTSKYPDQCAANEKRLAISAWAQYFLDNFASVKEVIDSLKTHPVCLISAPIPGTDRFTTLHLSLSDASGNSAILEYINGKLAIHEGRQYQVLTNDPEFPQQLAVARYWEGIGGTRFLPGSNQAPDRFARADFYIHAIPKTASNQVGVAQVFSVLNNVSVPMGISTPGHPNISTTRWRVVADQKDLKYYFNSTSSLDLFWVDLNKADLRPGAPVRVLPMGQGQTYSGDVVDKFDSTKPFQFVPVPPEVLAAYR